jgi:hypothetical protein
MKFGNKIEVAFCFIDEWRYFVYIGTDKFSIDGFH